MARSVEYLDFTPDALEPVLDQMRAIGRARNGWVNVRPIPLSDESEERLTEFAPTPPVAPVGLFARWRLVLIEGTWVPGQAGAQRRRATRRWGCRIRPGASPSANSATPACRYPTGGGWWSTTPAGAWCSRVPDGPATTAGPSSGGPADGDASAAVDVVLPWLLAAGTALGPDQITGRWRAEVHRR